MTESAAKMVLRELGQLNRKSVFDEKAILEPDESNSLILSVTLTPTDGLFAGTKVPFEFTFSDDYPACAPSVRSVKIVYHSNISDGSVCLNMLTEPDPSYRVEHYVNGLLWLLDNQNFNSQLNGHVTMDKALFKVNFRLACLGYVVGGLSADDIMVKMPTTTERRKLVNEIFHFSKPQLAEQSPAELKNLLSKHEPAHLQFVQDELPFLSKLFNEQPLNRVTLLWSKSKCTHGQCPTFCVFVFYTLCLP